MQELWSVHKADRGRLARRSNEPPGVDLRLLEGALATPNIVCVDASEHRASLAARANVLSLGFDTQETAQGGECCGHTLWRDDCGPRGLIRPFR